MKWNALGVEICTKNQKDQHGCCKISALKRGEHGYNFRANKKDFYNHGSLKECQNFQVMKEI